MKFNSKKRNFITTIFVFTIIILAIILCFENTKIKELFIIITSIVAVIAVLIQIKGARELATGEFVLSLQQEYSANENHSELFIKCWKALKEDKEEIFDEKDDINILNYLTFFESMYIMVINNVLSMQMLDELFGRRFFILINNIKIQEKDLVENYLYYLNIFRLHALWKVYRIKNGNEIFAEDNVVNEKKDKYSNVHLRDLQCALAEKVEDGLPDKKGVKRNNKKINKNSIYFSIYKHCPLDKKEWDEQWSFWKKKTNCIFYEYK